jgi:hypothetical protein
MNCEWVIRSIPLYHYGELAPDDEEWLEDHLDGCRECRDELERYRKLSVTLDARRQEPSTGVLSECRLNLIRAVYQEPAVRRPPESNPWKLFREAFSALLSSVSRWRVPVGAVALVALGYFGARLPDAVRPSPPAPEFTYATVRSVQPDSGGRVQISLDETRRRTVLGDLGDSNIQRLLLAAARDESNAAVRVESMDALKNHAISDEVRTVLLYALSHDPNPGVRLKALEGLKSAASTAQISKALAQVLLKDENPGVRIQAIDMLIAHGDDSVVGVLQNVVQKENNSYIRMRCERVLREMNASVGTF